MMRRRGRNKMSLMRRGMSKRTLKMRKVRSRRIPLRVMRILERLWESHNRHCLQRIRKGRRSLRRRRRRKVNYN